MKEKDKNVFYLYKLGLWFFPLVLGMVFCHIADTFFIIGLTMSLSLMYRLRKVFVNLTCLDCLIVSICVWEICLLLFSVNTFQNIHYLKMSILLTMYYLIIRIDFKGVNRIRRLLLIYAFIISFCLIVSLALFFVWKNSLIGVGFYTLRSFRHLYTPFGMPSNQWSTLLFGFIGILSLTLLYFHRNKKIYIFIIGMLLLGIWQIILSFSRGMYISFFVLLLLSIGYVLRLKVYYTFKIIWIVSALFACFVFIYPVRNDVFCTLKMNQEVLQQRSSLGRVDAIKAVFCISKEKLLTGVGGGNFSLAIDKYRYEDDNIGYTSFAPNIVVQLLLEKGIIGVLLWVIIIGIILINFKRDNNRNLGQFVIVAMLLCIMIKELTFASFFESLVLQWMVYTFIALYQNKLTRGKNNFFTFKGLYLGGAFVFVALLMTFLSCFHYKNEEFNRKSIEAFKVGDYNLSICLMERTLKSTPYLINRGILYWNMYVNTRNNDFLDKSVCNFREAIRKNPYDMQLCFYNAFVSFSEKDLEVDIEKMKKMIEEFPNNAFLRMNLFQILYSLKLVKESIPHLACAIMLAPQILDSSFWLDLSQKDKELVCEVKNEIRKYMAFDFSNPILLAKYGKVWMALGESSYAKEYINRALKQLPSLSQAWYNLGVIEYEKGKLEKANLFAGKYKMLKNKLLLPSSVDSISLNIKTLSNFELNQLLQEKYFSKFQRWYLSSSLTMNIIN